MSKDNDFANELEENIKENEKFKKKQRIIRDEFEKVGKYGIPIIKKQNIDISKIELWGYAKAKLDEDEYNSKTIHFFMHDWKFDNVYEKADVAMEKLAQYYALLTPDFSCYANMPIALQINSTFKSRWCGAYWQSQGMKVIPTINWSVDESYEFCFDGIEKGSVVAISTYYIKENDRGFIEGYNKMLEVIEPSAIICYGEQFKSMRGNIKCISPYNKDQLIKELGFDEFTKRYIEGTLYSNI